MKNFTKELKKQQQIRDRLWFYLLHHIDDPNWNIIKRKVNKLNDNILNLRNMKTELPEFRDMRKNRRQAIKALRAIKQVRKGKKFSLIKMDQRTWKEIEIH